MRAAVALLFAVGLIGCDKVDNQSTSLALPTGLREVSGLADAGPDSVWAHDDEHAIVHEVDVRDGHIVRSFALGKPTLDGDFEGIAAVGNSLYLVTSDGVIYSFQAGEHRQRVPFRAHDSGLGPRCEIEGLSRAPDDAYLLILCKRLRSGEDIPRLEIYRWLRGSEHADLEPWRAIPLDRFLEASQRAEFAPSGLEWDAERERLLVVSGRNQLLVELDAEGGVLATHRLDSSQHPQTEGIAILPGCRLVLADEGSETSRARLSVYPCPKDSAGR